MGEFFCLIFFLLQGGIGIFKTSLLMLLVSQYFILPQPGCEARCMFNYENKTKNTVLSSADRKFASIVTEHDTYKVDIIPESWQSVLTGFFWFAGILGSASLSIHIGFTPRLLYSSTHHSPESFTHPKTG